MKSASWIRRSVALAALLAGTNAVGLLLRMRAQSQPFARLEASLDLEHRARQAVDRVLRGDDRIRVEIAKVEQVLDIALSEDLPDPIPTDTPADESGTSQSSVIEQPEGTEPTQDRPADAEMSEESAALYQAWTQLERALLDYSGGKTSSSLELNIGLEAFTDAVLSQREHIRSALAASRTHHDRLALTLALTSMGVSILAYALHEGWLRSLSQVTIDSRDRIDSVSVSIAHQKQVVSDQATSVAEITQMLEKLSATSQQSSEQASIAAARAQQIVQLTATGAEQMSQTSSTIAEMEGQALAIFQQVQQLRAQAGEVGQIALLVEELAMRTNTLSLNAGIEAVRAGRSGAGFQAIAQEIRDLSVQSQQAAQRIGALSDDIQTATDETAHTSKDGIDRVEASTRVFSETTATFADIQTAVEEVKETSHRLAFNSYEQLWPLQQLVEAMEALNTSAHDTETNSTTLACGLDDLEVSFSYIQKGLGQRREVQTRARRAQTETEEKRSTIDLDLEVGLESG